MTDAATVIATLGLEPHPEGGYYRETWREAVDPGRRPAGSAIYYLLAAGQRSHWHRIDATEVWHHYAGGPLELSIAAHSEDPPGRYVLGPALAAGERPQLIVPVGAWQSAAPLGPWSLVGCTVSPAFRFEGFELAEPGWEPGTPPPRPGEIARREDVA